MTTFTNKQKSGLVATPARFLEIGEGFNLEIGGGFKLVIQPDISATTWKTQNKT